MPITRPLQQVYNELPVAYATLNRGQSYTVAADCAFALIKATGARRGDNVLRNGESVQYFQEVRCVPGDVLVATDSDCRLEVQRYTDGGLAESDRPSSLPPVPSGQIQALVSGDWIDPATTFANLPSAALSTGKVYRVSDVGPVAAGSYWVSDGARWRPLNGRALHCSASGTLAAPLVTLSGAAGKFVLPAGDRVTAGSILLPVGLPQIGQGVEVSAKVLHRGTAGTWNFVGRLGSLNTSSDPSFMQVTGAATNDQSCWLNQDLEVVTATSFVASTFAVPNQAGVGAVVLRNSNFNNAAQLYLSFYSSTFTSGDFIDLISYRVYLLG